jgi:hemerythrin-like domain-containing protein
MLHEAVEEHLAAKRIISDLLDTDAADEQLKARVKVLKEQIEHHVHEEEEELFPAVKNLLEPEELEELAEEMQELAEELREQGAPRMQVPNETDRPAPI